MNWEYYTEASTAIQIHMIAALVALILGILMLLRQKGTASHKMIGRIFAALMFVTAFSAIFIRQLNEGRFSWIHIFVIFTFVALIETFYHIRKGNLKDHKRAVMGLFFGALLIPGAFSFLPGRTMWMLFFA